MHTQPQRQGGEAVDFVAVVDQVITLLCQRGRLTYRTLQLQFRLDKNTCGDPQATNSSTASAWRWMRTAGSWSGLVRRGLRLPLPQPQQASQHGHHSPIRRLTSPRKF